MKKYLFSALCCALIVGGFVYGLPGSALAYDVEIHGYGNQDFMKSSKNQYLNAKDGTWEHNTMSLVFTANVTDDTSVWSKIFAESEKTAVEWLYVDKKFGNDVDARFGQMKLPLGIFNLIRDNKFLHLSELDPMMYSENVDIIFENFRGVDLEYHSKWLTLNLFGGAPEFEEGEEGGAQVVDTVANTVTTTSSELSTKNLFGARLELKTPVEGLSFILSGSQFEEEETTKTVTLDLAAPGTVTEDIATEKGDEKLWMASLNFERSGLDLKAEYARKTGINEKMASWYAEAGYTLFEKLTPFVRYDYLTRDRDNKSDLWNYQKDITVGLGYTVNNYVKLKVEDHFLKGYAMPVATGEVEAGAGEQRWNLIVAGINFMF